MCIHPNVVETVKTSMPPDEEMYELAELYKIFGDSTRIRILYALIGNEMCVCDIALLLEMSHSAISHQLRILKQAKLIRSRRDGKNIFYALADDHVNGILKQGIEHIEE